jgi:fibronectin-binding autotransporter adhesin
MAPIMAAGAVAHGATSTWTGGAATGAWGTATNWSPASVPTSSNNTALGFNNAVQLTQNENIGSPFFLNGMTFETTAGSFHFTGAAASLDFVNSSALVAPTVTQNSANGQLDSLNTIVGGALTVGGTGSGALIFGGAVSGAGSITKNGSFTLVLGGGSLDTTANSMTGAITASAGTITLDKAIGSAAIAGDLFVVGSGSIAATRNNLLGANTNVTLNGSGTFAVGSATFASLTVTGSGGFGGGTYTLGSAGTALSLGGGIGVPIGVVISSPANFGDITLLNNNTFSSTISGSIDLGGFSRNFNVPDNTGSSADDLIIPSIISNGALRKNGTGTLALTGSNSYSSGTTIAGGIVRISADAALGSGPVAFLGGTLQSSASFSSARSLQFVSGSNGVIDTGANNLTYTGAITGGGTGVKVSSGSLTIGGGSADTTANSNTGTFTVSAGTLTLDKAAGTVALGGDLVVAGGTVNFNRSGQTTSSINIIQKNGGVLNFGLNNVIGSYAFGGGGSSIAVSPLIFTSTGTALTLNTDGFFGGLTYDFTGASGGGIVVNSPTGFTLANSIDFGGVTRTLTIARGTGAADFNITGDIQNGGINKTGAGILELSGSSANTYTGPTTISQGSLVLAKSGVAVPGPLSASGGSLVQLQASEQIAATSSVTVAGATLNLGGFTQTLNAPVLLAGATVTGGTINLGGDITAPPQSGQTVINSNLNLTPGTRTINVAQTPSSDTTNISFTGAISGSGGLIFTGSGNNNGNVNLAGSVSNTFTGGATIQTYVFLNNAPGTVVLPGPVTIGGAAFGELLLNTDNPIATSAALTINANGVLADLSGVLSQTVSSLNFSGGLVTKLILAAGGNGTMGPGAVIDGTLINNGAMTVSAGEVNGTLQNNGTMIFTGGLDVSATFQNSGVLTLPAGHAIVGSRFGSLSNSGTMNLMGGTINGIAIDNQNTLIGFGTLSGVGFLSEGYISVTGGALTISSSSASNSGNIDVQPTGQIQLATALTNIGAINLLGGQITSGGAAGVITNTGTLAGRGTVAVPLTNNGTVQPQGGALNITGNFTNDGVVQLTSGSILTGNGITSNGTIQGAGSISEFVTNGGTIDPTGGTLIFSGSVNQVGTIRVTSGNKALFLSSSLTQNQNLISLNGGTLDTNGTALNNFNGQIVGFGTLSTGGLNNNGTIILGGGATTVNGAITNQAGRSFSVQNGSAVFTGQFVNQGNFSVTNGSATFGTTPIGVPAAFTPTASSAGGLDGDGVVTVNSGASVLSNYIRDGAATFGGTVTLRSSAQGGDVSILNSLTMTAGAKLDLNDNDLIVNYSGASPISAIAGLLKSGFNSGFWNGSGIDSQAAAANASSLTALGYADAASLGITSFDGQNVSNAVLVKYTYYGDNNLDGKVDVNDFRMFLDGLVAASGSSWSQGDYTYDGKVDIGNDFNLFLLSYLKQGGALGELAPLVSADTALSTSQKAALLPLVPEPCGLALLGIAFTASLATRKRGSRNSRQTTSAGKPGTR